MLIFSGTSDDVLTVKTPSFFELKTLVEILSEDLAGSQLQDVNTTEDGIVLTMYRFQKIPRMKYLVFDLDKPFPFLGMFDEHPWPGRKKSKPTGLFLNAHAKNLFLYKVELIEKFGRVVEFVFGKSLPQMDRSSDLLQAKSQSTSQSIGVPQADQEPVEPGQDKSKRQMKIQIRLIPKQANLLAEACDEKGKTKTISWYPVHALAENEVYTAGGDADDQRSIPFLMKQWFERRSLMSQKARVQQGAAHSSLSPYEKWQKQKEKDIAKKTNALNGIQKQIDLYYSEPWAQVGEHLKLQGFKNLPPEWSKYVVFDHSVSENMQNAFAKAKNAKAKIQGALERQRLIQAEIVELQDLSEKRFEAEMKRMADKKNKIPVRTVEGRVRKLNVNEDNVVCYMGKSAQDNLALLRKAKAWDYWMHLKDYPGAHAIIHRQKDQGVPDQDLFKCARWLVREGLGEKQVQLGGRFAVVMSECRHVRPIKGDKLGRVTYHEGREFLIAL